MVSINAMSWIKPAATMGFKSHSIILGFPGSFRVPHDVTQTILCTLLLSIQYMIYMISLGYVESLNKVFCWCLSANLHGHNGWARALATEPGSTRAERSGTGTTLNRFAAVFTSLQVDEATTPNLSPISR